MPQPVFMLLLSPLVLFILGSDATKTSEHEALLSFRYSVDDPVSSLSSWKPRNDHCGWRGVFCSSNGSVVGLYLSSQSLSAPFPFSALKGLPLLRNLSISNNNFTGSIDSLLTKDCRLEILDLSVNRFTGNCSALCKGLKVLNASRNEITGISSDVRVGDMLVSLDLSRNKIFGAVPTSMLADSCGGLEVLDMSYNRLVGQVPEDILITCPSLRHLSLASNNFSGVFPALRTSVSLQSLNISANLLTSLSIERQGCERLEVLDASLNRLSGTVFWRDCGALKRLDLSDNVFAGPILDVFGSRPLEKSFPSLQALRAHHNGFTGEVPGLPPVLEELDLSCNSLGGSNNKSICSKGSLLKSLILVYNRLTGPILNSVMDCRSLEMLDLSLNSMITGSLPKGMCSSLPKLKHLVLWGNSLEGSIPSTIEDCKELVTLSLSYNRLTGEIPEQITTLRKIRLLFLDFNMLSGVIPQSMGNLSNCGQIILLSHNKLHGSIPFSLANCNELLVFSVSNNWLTGSVPSWIGRSRAVEYDARKELPFLTVYTINTNPYGTCKGFQEIYILQGIRLEEFEQLPIATRCRTWNYLLPGNSNLGQYSEMTSPLYLDLSNNRLTGSIPAEFGRMHDLNILWLGDNSLTGAIPTSLGDLKNLACLDLSSNRLESSIPESLSNLTFLKVFNLSHNRLTGRIPQGGQLPTFYESSYEGNDGLCGLPLGRCQAPLINRGEGYYEERAVHDANGELAGFLGAGIVSCVLWSALTAFFMPVKVEHQVKKWFCL